MITMNPETEVARLLKDSNAVLIRDKKHLVWELPDGRKFTQSATPSDRRAYANQLTDLRALLGVADPERGQPGERREHKANHVATEVHEIHSAGRVTGSFAEKLSAAGLVEAKLKEQIRQREDRIEDLNAVLEMMGAIVHEMDEQAIEAAEPKCWWCKLKAWMKGWTA